MTTCTQAVVVGAGINGLGVARSLARAGVACRLLDCDGSQPAMHTRAAHCHVVDALHGDGLVRALVHMGIAHYAGKRPVLMLTREESVKTVSEHRERLAPLYRFTLPPREVVNALLNKHDFQRLAEHHGLPIPKMVRVRSSADLDTIGQLQFPVVVKPGERHAEYARHFRKAYRLDTPGEATELVAAILAVMSDVVVQEWTEGPDSNLYFCLQYIDEHGRLTAAFTGRKVRAWPPQVGGTASCIPAPEMHETLSWMTTRFFDAVGMRGLAAMEYKLDARRGGFRMIEPTIGRTDYQAEVATLNGVNLPHAAYCALSGERFSEPAAPRRPCAWRVHDADLRSALAQQHAAGLGFEEARVVDAVWRPSDPAPCLFRNLVRVRRALRTRTARLLPWTRVAGERS